MITEIDITRFNVLSDLRQDQIEYIKTLQNKRPRIGKKFPTYISLSQDLNIPGTKIYKDNAFIITPSSYKKLPTLWNKKTFFDYRFDYKGKYDESWEFFVQRLCTKIFNQVTVAYYNSPEIDFVKKLCKNFLCKNGINELSISNKGIHLCKYSKEIVEGDITEICDCIEKTKNNVKSYCNRCICFNQCNIKCGVVEKDMDTCEAIQTFYSYIYQLEEKIFAYLYIDFPINDIHTEGREFFELKDLSVETISTYADKDIVPCLKLSSNDLDKMLSEDNRLYLDMRVLDKLEFWLPCTHEDIYKYNKLLKKLKYIKPFNLYPEKEDDYEIIRFYMNKQINFSLFPKQKYTNIYEFWL